MLRLKVSIWCELYNDLFLSLPLVKLGAFYQLFGCVVGRVVEGRARNWTSFFILIWDLSEELLLGLRSIHVSYTVVARCYMTSDLIH